MVGKSTARCRVREVHQQTEPMLHDWSGTKSFSRRSRHLDSKQAATTLGSVGQRERGPHESFSLVSPYSSVSKPRGGPLLIMGKESRTWAGAQLRTCIGFP
jgi:hypothetical protein